METINVGDTVEVCGLQTVVSQKFNRKRGTIVALENTYGRYQVDITDEDETLKKINVKVTYCARDSEKEHTKDYFRSNRRLRRSSSN